MENIIKSKRNQNKNIYQHHRRSQYEANRGTRLGKILSNTVDFYFFYQTDNIRRFHTADFVQRTVCSPRLQFLPGYGPEHGTYNLETVSEETFEMRITGEPKEPNLESFSLTWSANHLSVYNSSRPYRRVILQPVHLSGIRQSVCSHGTVGYLSSKVCLGMRQFFIVEIHNFPISRYKSPPCFISLIRKRFDHQKLPVLSKDYPPLPYQEKISSLFVIASEKRDFSGVVVLRSKAMFWIFYRYQIILFFSLRLTKQRK